jgi:hypothetical protein
VEIWGNCCITGGCLFEAFMTIIKAKKYAKMGNTLRISMKLPVYSSHISVKSTFPRSQHCHKFPCRVEDIVTQAPRASPSIAHPANGSRLSSPLRPKQWGSSAARFTPAQAANHGCISSCTSIRLVFHKILRFTSLIPKHDAHLLGSGARRYSVIAGRLPLAD